ncbi:hypothetical protein CDCA_CDCA19G4687 [Cyanidium caldarium]|uniref:BRCA2 OB1 domain-containing protein n=1 Tax=Cyanidium caldarium TaxID=2771 RepID=A0AAV9J256_CYACA|nr:hypothetical protein CDCA_CDCA19G4687 [Cyanidium caldarium]
MKLSPAGTETNNGREAGVAVLDASWVGESEVRGALLGKRPADEEAVRDAAVRSETDWARCHWEELLRETESRSPRASKRQRVQGQRDERQGEQVQTLAPGRDEKMAPEATSESMEDASVDLSFDTEEAVSDLHSFGGEGNAQFGLLASPGTTNDEVPLNVLHSPPQPSGGFQTGTGKALQAHQGSAMLLQRLFGDAPAVSDAHVPAAAAPSGFRSGGGAQLQASARAAERVHCLFADDRSDTGAAQEPPRPAADTPEQDIFVDAAMRAPPPARASRWTAAFRQPRKSVSRTRCLPRTAPTARPTAPTLPRMSPDAVPRQSPPPPPIPAVTSCRQPRCPRAAFTPDEAHRFVFTGARLDFAALLRACGETEAYAGMLRVGRELQRRAHERPPPAHMDAADIFMALSADSSLSHRDALQRALDDRPSNTPLQQPGSWAWFRHHYALLVYVESLVEMTDPSTRYGRVLTVWRLLWHLTRRYWQWYRAAARNRAVSVLHALRRDEPYDMLLPPMELLVTRVPALPLDGDVVRWQCTDGQCCMSAALILPDGASTPAIRLSAHFRQLSRLRPGARLYCFGAQLRRPSEATGDAEPHLAVSLNGCRLLPFVFRQARNEAPWLRCLGRVRHAMLLTPLSHAVPNGGLVGAIHALLQRVYPLHLLEFVNDAEPQRAGRAAARVQVYDVEQARRRRRQQQPPQTPDRGSRVVGAALNVDDDDRLRVPDWAAPSECAYVPACSVRISDRSGTQYAWLRISRCDEESVRQLQRLEGQTVQLRALLPDAKRFGVYRLVGGLRYGANVRRADTTSVGGRGCFWPRQTPAFRSLPSLSAGDEFDANDQAMAVHVGSVRRGGTPDASRFVYLTDQSDGPLLAVELHGVDAEHLPAALRPLATPSASATCTPVHFVNAAFVRYDAALGVSSADAPPGRCQWRARPPAHIDADAFRAQRARAQSISEGGCVSSTLPARSCWRLWEQLLRWSHALSPPPHSAGERPRHIHRHSPQLLP